jgi:Pyridine nucleotide-disulphide oxidoreductase
MGRNECTRIMPQVGGCVVFLSISATLSIEGIWTGLRNFLRPFRGVSKWVVAGYVALFDRSGRSASFFDLLRLSRCIRKYALHKSTNRSKFMNNGLLDAHIEKQATSASTARELPIAIIGAGPVGLAAAAHLVQRGLTPLLFERGPAVGHALRAWSHVRVFSPWRYNIDAAAHALLEQTGWSTPDPEALPTGSEIAGQYLEPLATHPTIAPHIVFQAEVFAIGREGLDKVTTQGREAAPFVIRWRDASGERHAARARAVIDASGTWFSPNPIGIDGGFIQGEQEASDRIVYGIPDVFGELRARYAEARVLVVGAGHSAINVVLDLLRLQETSPELRVVWALRKSRLDKLLGGGLNDQLPARGALGLAARQAIDAGRLQLLAPFAAERIDQSSNGLRISAQLDGQPFEIDVDQIVVATGFRPQIDMLRELRVSLDPILEAPPALAPLIDPNVHSCGTVPPHGAVELAHPEPGFYLVGSKSYGRAPTFLMATGYEQVRSVVAEIAGDHAAARDVRLVLPETGVCSTSNAYTLAETGVSDATAAGCCGGPAPAGADACCVKDADAKAAGLDGCGCGATETLSSIRAALAGSELVRPVIAVSAGDVVSAHTIQLVPAESGAGGASAAGCCGGPAPAGADACCVKDADAKAAGLDGCGCGTTAVTAPEPVAAGGGGCCG